MFHIQVDLVAHVAKFTNLELYSRGLYFVKLSGNSHHNAGVATPYATFAKPPTLDSFVGGDRVPYEAHEVLFSGELSGDGSSYVTRVIPIRYRDETVELNEGAHFQLTFPADQADTDAELHVALFFCPFVKGVESRSLADLIPPQPQFECVATQRLLIRQVARGLHAFYPVTFDDMHLCEVEMTFHTLVTNLKFEASHARPVKHEHARSRDVEIACYLFPPANSLAPESKESPEAAAEAAETQQAYVFRPRKEVEEAGLLLKQQYVRPLLTAHKFATESLEWAASLFGLESTSKSRCNSSCSTSSLHSRGDPPHLQMQFAAAGDVDPAKVLEDLELLELSEVPEEVRAIEERLFPKDAYQRGDVDVVTAVLSLGRWPVPVQQASPEVVTLDRLAEAQSPKKNMTPGFLLPTATFMKHVAMPIVPGQEAATPIVVSNELVSDLHTVAQYCFIAWTKFATLVPMLSKIMTRGLRRQWRADSYRLWTSRLSTHACRKGYLLVPRSCGELEGLCDDMAAHTSSNAPEWPSIVDLNTWGDALFKTADARALPVGIVEQYMCTHTLSRVSGHGETIQGHFHSEAEKATRSPGEERIISQSRRRGGLFLEAFSEENEEVLAQSLVDNDRGARHVIIVVHGYEGTAFDMRMLKNWLRVLLPESIVFASKANESSSELPLAEMGGILAKEVRSFLLDKAPWIVSGEGGRLSFVGHSIGSLIVRSALTDPLLRLFLPRLHCFISLASPHLGQMFSRSQIVQSGIWAITKLRRADVLTELKLLDHRDKEQTCLYSLSQQSGLECFNHLILVGSHQDDYVPLHSARIQICEEAEKASEKEGGPLLIRMAANLVAPCKPSGIIRMCLRTDFSKVSSSLDTMIGRAAHIAYLDDPALVKLLLTSLIPVLCEGSSDRRSEDAMSAAAS
uniref:DUF676 domain-containing protein n=2 Tax=Pinguiococcus pyrenoidosus TaxID=172671 RepID=A0A7R9YFS5_9STRA